MTVPSEDPDTRETDAVTHREQRVITLRFPPALCDRTASNVDVQPLPQEHSLPASAPGNSDASIASPVNRIPTHGLSLAPGPRRNSVPNAVPIRTTNSRPAQLVRREHLMVDLNGTQFASTARRRWPAVIAFTVAGLLVALIFTGVLLRPREPAMSDSSPDLAAASSRGTLPKTGEAPAVSGAPVQSSQPRANAGLTHKRPVAKPTAGRRRNPDVTSSGRESIRPKPNPVGIPVNEIYVNSKGELVDALGKPLSTVRPLQPGAPE